jgi:hypothetical protein
MLFQYLVHPFSQRTQRSSVRNVFSLRRRIPACRQAGMRSLRETMLSCSILFPGGVL